MQATTYSNYPIFEADQVLTSKHLNDLVNYLEEQERFTRSKLIGIGIACGLDLSLSNDKTTVSISPGVGITSEGYLVAFHGRTHGEAAHYSFFRPFTFGERPAYSFFEKGNRQIDLFELHEQKVEEAEPFTEIEGDIEDYAVFLFLDCLDKKLKNCVENDCNEKGTERSFTIRPLLVKKSDARDIICREEELNVPKSEAEIDAYVNARFRLPALEVPRFRLNNNKLDHYNDLFVRYDSLIDKYIPHLQQTLRLAYDRFKPVLKNKFGNANPFQNNGNTDLQAKYLTVKNKPPFAVQYFYGLLRDLTDTYKEFREAAFDLMCECCPPPGCFPKHLNLGGLRTTASCEPSPYRTRFTYSPILNDQGKLKEQVLSLFKKLTLLPAKFVVSKTEQIKITPGRAAHEVPSKRAMPYYYNILNDGELLKNWDADRLRKCRFNENLSYHSNRFAGTVPHVLHPLQYDHEQYDFLRIEGHLGMNYRTALTRILAIRNRENLPFDLVALKMSANASGTTIDFSECHFRDLEIMCEAWRKELECMLGDVVKGVSRVGIGHTLKQQRVGGRAATSPFSVSAFAPSRPLFTTSAVAGTIRPNVNVGDNVKETIEVREDTIGEVLNEAVKVGGVGGGDFYVHAESILLKDEAIRALPRDEYEVAFAAPILVAARAVAFAERVDSTCDQLDIEKMETSMKALVDAASRYLQLLTNHKETAASKVQVNTLQMIRLMSILIGRCTLEQLKIIKTEIERRKDQLRQMNLFSEYVAKNPGIEHQAGVPKGGTFILVYHEISRQDTIVHKGPFTLRGRVVNKKNRPIVDAVVSVKDEPKIPSTATDLSGSFTIRVRQLPTILETRVKGVVIAEMEVTQPGKSILIRPGQAGVTEVFPSPDRFTVFADFSLPYLCCSDCPPIDYVILPPEGKEALELTPKSYCMPVDEGFPGALFSVYPARGIVTGPGVSGEAASGFVFKPNDIDMAANDELEVKGFKVNGEDVPLVVMLYKKPEAKFQAVVEVLDLIDEGQLGQLILTNQSSENAIKFRWTIQRVFIEGKIIENHIIETEKREVINVQILAKRGEQFKVVLEAFSEHCEGRIEQVVEIQFQQREVSLTLLGPDGKPLDTTTIPRNAQGVFTLLAAPGRGELGPREAVKKLKMELAKATPESNRYVFSPRRGQGTFTLKYALPEGPSKNISITIKGGGGGGGGLRPIRPNIPPVVVVPPFRPIVVVGGGRSAGTDPTIDRISSHPTLIVSVRNDNRFRALLGPSSDAFKVTSNLTEDLLSRMADSSLATELVAGDFNKDFSAKMSVALKDTAKRLIETTKQKDRDFIFQLFKLQLEQVAGMAAIQKKDLSTRDPLSKLMTEAIAEVKKLQSKGVKTDKRKALSKSLTALATGIKKKRKIKERVNALIAQIKKG